MRMDFVKSGGRVPGRPTEGREILSLEMEGTSITKKKSAGPIHEDAGQHE